MTDSARSLGTARPGFIDTAFHRPSMNRINPSVGVQSRWQEAWGGRMVQEPWAWVLVCCLSLQLYTYFYVPMFPLFICQFQHVSTSWTHFTHVCRPWWGFIRQPFYRISCTKLSSMELCFAQIPGENSAQSYVSQLFSLWINFLEHTLQIFQAWHGLTAFVL